MTTIVHKQENVDIYLSDEIDGDVCISQVASDDVQHTVIFHKKHLPAVIRALEELEELIDGEPS
jgi:hypothetical protein